MSKMVATVRKLGSDECWELLRENTFGRLAYQLRGRTRIAPINYAVDEGRLIFRTAEGSKFYALQVDDAVAFEIDSHDDDQAWSVVAQGRVAEILDAKEMKEATVHLRPWVRTKKKHVLSIAIDELTGRRFAIAAPEER